MSAGIASMSSADALAAERAAAATHKLNELYIRWWSCAETQALCDGIL